MVVDAKIKKQLKANNYQRDENGDIWELRATLQLPFKCQPQFYSRDGKVLKSFRMRNNGRGFSWGFFWLLAWTPQKPKPQKRIGGKLVTVTTEEESSLYTEKTYISMKPRKKWAYWSYERNLKKSKSQKINTYSSTRRLNKFNESQTLHKIGISLLFLLKQVVSQPIEFHSL